MFQIDPPPNKITSWPICSHVLWYCCKKSCFFSKVLKNKSCKDNALLLKSNTYSQFPVNVQEKNTKSTMIPNNAVNKQLTC